MFLLQTFAFLSLANKMLFQCEAQVVKLQSFAFPLAMVVVNVGSVFPLFMDLLLAKLHRACPLAVPKYACRVQGETAAGFLQRLGFRKAESGEGLESSDDFSNRLQGYMLFYAAIGQVSAPSNPHPSVLCATSGYVS